MVRDLNHHKWKIEKQRRTEYIPRKVLYPPKDANESFSAITWISLLRERKWKPAPWSWAVYFYVTQRRPICSVDYAKTIKL